MNTRTGTYCADVTTIQRLNGDNCNVFVKASNLLLIIIISILLLVLHLKVIFKLKHYRRFVDHIRPWKLFYTFKHCSSKQSQKYRRESSSSNPSFRIPDRLYADSAPPVVVLIRRLSGYLSVSWVACWYFLSPSAQWNWMYVEEVHCTLMQNRRILPRYGWVLEQQSKLATSKSNHSKLIIEKFAAFSHGAGLAARKHRYFFPLFTKKTL